MLTKIRNSQQTSTYTPRTKCNPQPSCSLVKEAESFCVVYSVVSKEMVTYSATFIWLSAKGFSQIINEALP